jgi:uncharacterized protein YbgA (DUF1722 family)
MLVVYQGEGDYMENLSVKKTNQEKPEPKPRENEPFSVGNKSANSEGQIFNASAPVQDSTGKLPVSNLGHSIRNISIRELPRGVQGEILKKLSLNDQKRVTRMNLMGQRGKAQPIDLGEFLKNLKPEDLEVFAKDHKQRLDTVLDKETKAKEDHISTNIKTMKKHFKKLERLQRPSFFQKITDFRLSKDQRQEEIKRTKTNLNGFAQTFSRDQEVLEKIQQEKEPMERQGQTIQEELSRRERLKQYQDWQESLKSRK